MLLPPAQVLAPMAWPGGTVPTRVSSPSNSSPVEKEGGELGMESVVHKLNAECLWFGEGLEGDQALAALSGKVVTTSPTKVVRRWQWPLPGG